MKKSIFGILLVSVMCLCACSVSAHVDVGKTAKTEVGYTFDTPVSANVVTGNENANFYMADAPAYEQVNLDCVDNLFTAPPNDLRINKPVRELFLKRQQPEAITCRDYVSNILKIPGPDRRC